MNAKQLRDALIDIDDDMIVLLRVSNEDTQEQFMCSPSGAVPDAGCGEVEAFIIDGTDGQCHHEAQAADCEQCKLEEAEN